jgi:hypothetical protein
VPLAWGLKHLERERAVATKPASKRCFSTMPTPLLIIGVQSLLSFIAFGLIARWYLVPWLSKFLARRSLGCTHLATRFSLCRADRIVAGASLGRCSRLCSQRRCLRRHNLGAVGTRFRNLAQGTYARRDRHGLGLQRRRPLGLGAITSCWRERSGIRLSGWSQRLGLRLLCPTSGRDERHDDLLALLASAQRVASPRYRRAPDRGLDSA